MKEDESFHQIHVLILLVLIATRPTCQVNKTKTTWFTRHLVCST